MLSDMGRTYGSKELSDEERATILAKKNVRVATRGEIAEEHGVSKRTVYHITPETESTAVVIRAKQIEEDLQSRIERVRDKALDSLEHAIDSEDLKKEALIQVFSTLFDKGRTASGQPTSYAGFSPEQVDRFRTGFRNLLINLFQHFKADEERPEPIDRDEAERLVRIALGETQ